MADYSVVEYLADHDGYRCGYCGSSNSNFSRGMWTHSLTCQDYQDLIDRGWRRSGKYTYKPTMDKMCCPSYTIRCEALKFKASKSQKKVLKKVTRFLVSGKRPGQITGEDGCSMEGNDVMSDNGVGRPQRKFADCDVQGLDAKKVDMSAVDKEKLTKTREASPKDATLMPKKQCSKTNKPKKESKQSAGPDPSKPPCKKAKQLRLERKQQRLAQRQATAEAKQSSGIAAGTDGKSQTASAKTPGNTTKSLEQLMIDAIPGQDPKHKLEVRLVRSSPWSPEFQETFYAEFAIYKKYQIIIHKDPPSKCTERQVRLVRSTPRSAEFERTVKQSHAIYAKYQMTVHKDPPKDCDMMSFTRFLVDSPLQPEHSDGSPECGYGSFHQQYWIDDKLVAVGVIDILPKSVSSVYLFYDPDYGFLNLGTFSALRELYFVRLLHNTAPSLEYYYMGFYIHSCQKMKYKGKYYPSYLACPEAFSWQPIDKCVPKLDVTKYARLDEDKEATDPECLDSLDRVLVLYKQVAMLYAQFKRHKPGSADDDVTEYAGMVGKTCAQRMLLYRR